MGHIRKYCDLQFTINFIDLGEDTPSGLWLRATVNQRTEYQYRWGRSNNPRNLFRPTFGFMTDGNGKFIICSSSGEQFTSWNSGFKDTSPSTWGLKELEEVVNKQKLMRNLASNVVLGEKCVTEPVSLMGPNKMGQNFGQDIGMMSWQSIRSTLL